MSKLLPRITLSCALALAASVMSPANAPAGDFAAELFAQWCDGTENVVFSPFSISAALAMTAAGARGETASQIAQALRLADAPERLPDAFADLDAQLTAARTAAPGLTLAVANSIWPQQSFNVQPAFTDLIRTRFKGEILPLDYVGQTEGARQTINRWVEQRTADRIKDLVPPGMLDQSTRMTLVNAIYFLGLWADPFDAKLTAEAPFHGPGGALSSARFMHRQGSMRYAETEDLQALELDYEGHRLTMLLLLPRPEHSLRDVASQWRGSGDKAWKSNLRSREVQLYMPRFTCTWMAECRDALEKLGIVNAFDPQRADFSGIAGKPGDLCISAVIHKAFVEVTEKGTEAAAATAVAMRLTAVEPPKPPVVFRADRPFAFLIREQQSGCVLFAGTVARP
ncbi:MAG: serpin family protein [Kiritimatiellae bacterium]|nr:serpin family protein [Kiritimatiellia bacterium]